MPILQEGSNARPPERLVRKRSSGSAPSAWRVTTVLPPPPTPSYHAGAALLHSPTPPPSQTCTGAFAPLALWRRARALENSTAALAPPFAPSFLPQAHHFQSPSQLPLREQNGSPRNTGLVLLTQGFRMVVSAGG